ncbi:hypothetical protein GAYE_SCF48G5997 [Galdieria yellowstonensis]|uniref:Cytochrome b561 domain-containing protein n=1 Tax=Galdieria yellowstonensis TaxID=3028027 RepID=A0AAV9IKV5_9RHOD|nr:hypothetical protein GAYE_SCF48G5997 [Galdieria yellowstonensis]
MAFVVQSSQVTKRLAVFKGFTGKTLCCPCSIRRRSYLSLRSHLGWEQHIKVAEEAIGTSSNPLVIQRVADYFKTLGIPENVEKYGHPVMMAIMIAFLGGATAYYGWMGRLNPDKKKGVSQKAFHANLATVFWLLAFAGASGGTLSVAMQGYPVWKSPHALSALAVLLGLTANAWIAFSGFGNTPATRQNGRKVHAYLGTAVMALLLVHSALGFSILQH